jgi:hypothetical protein
MIQRSPGGQFPALLIRPVISATSLSSSACPSCVTPGFHAAPGIPRMSASSVILSFRVSRVCDLLCPVVDSVADRTLAA